MFHQTLKEFNNIRQFYELTNGTYFVIEVEINVYSQALFLAGKGLYFISHPFYGHIQQSNITLIKDLYIPIIISKVNLMYYRLS